jgi:hypothetical protein
MSSPVLSRWRIDPAVVAAHEQVLAALPPRVEALDPSQLPALSEALAAVAVVRGPGAALPAIASLAPALQSPAQPSAKGALALAPPAALALLSLRSTAEACGGVAPSLERDRAAQKALSAIVRDAESLDRATRFSAAFAALSLGLVSLVPRAIKGLHDIPEHGGGMLAYNVTGALRHLAEALGAGAWPRNLSFASHQMILRFPERLAQGRMTWAHLVWAGHAYFRVGCARPVEETAASLHRVVESGAHGVYMDVRDSPARLDLRALMRRLSQPVSAALQDAVTKAVNARAAEVTLEQVLSCLIGASAPELTALLGELGIQAAAVSRNLDAFLAALPGGHTGKPTLSVPLVHWLHDASTLVDGPSGSVGSGLLLSLLVRDPTRSSARLDDVLPHVPRTKLARALSNLDPEPG